MWCFCATKNFLVELVLSFNCMQKRLAVSPYQVNVSENEMFR